MIDVKELSRSFGEFVAVDKISFRVENGEIYGLLGPNGSGKSTIMKILAGVLSPTQGRVLINDVDVGKNPLKIKEIVGYVPEVPVLYESLTPGELFDFVGKIRKMPGKLVEERVNYFTEAFGIEEYLNQFIGTLSLGTKQKISIIIALLHNPHVLILDEVMNGLDPKTARILRELLFEFRKEGKSMVFSTHVLPIAESICDRVGVIYRGQLVAEGEVSELKERFHEKSLEEVFLKLTESKDDISAIVKALRNTVIE